MEEIFKTLILYRVHINETWPQFAARFDGIQFPTLYRVLTGFNKPNDRTAYKIEKYYNQHRAEIEAVFGRELTAPKVGAP